MNIVPDMVQIAQIFLFHFGNIADCINVPDMVQCNHSKGKPKTQQEDHNMSTNEMESKIKELRELRRMADEIAAEIETLQDAIKSEMTARNTDTLTGTDWKVTWKAVTSKRFDSAAFKRTHGELYEQYTKETTSKRFLIA